MSAEDRLKQLGIVLPKVPTPVANYVPYRLAGNLLFLSGQGPRDEKGNTLSGKVGAEITVEEGYKRARLIGLGLLAATRQALGSLDRVEAVLKVLGMVNAVPDFKDHPKVINGCSDLFVDVLGEAGKHARSAVGMGSLPNQISVEIEAVLAVKP
jgi:enamine deaminase RidA (YjgF/YER057c/UK114 family)